MLMHHRLHRGFGIRRTRQEAEEGSGKTEFLAHDLFLVNC
jgi:hypothetical protein